MIRRFMRSLCSAVLVLPILLSQMTLAAIAAPVEVSTVTKAASVEASTGRPVEAVKPGYTRVSASGAVNEAVALSRAWSRSSTAVLVGSTNWAENITAPALAGALGAPILATTSSRLSYATDRRLSQLAVRTVYIVGGTRAVSTSVAKRLAAKRIRVIRLAGTNAAETARLVALRVKTITRATPVVIAVKSGDYARAAAVSAYSAAAAAPVLITNSTSVPSATKRALASLGATMTVIAGPTTVISAGAARSFPGATRIGGATAYDTSVLMAGFSVGRGMTLEKAVVTSGYRFADAMLAGPWAAREGSPILLTKPTSLPTSLKTYLEDSSASFKTLRVFGTTTRVNSRVVTDAMNAATTLMFEDIVKPDTAESGLHVTTLTDSAVSISGTDAEISELTSGSVLIGEPSPVAPSGYFRKVVSVQRVGNGWQAQTTDAALTDVVADGGFDVSTVTGADGANFAGIVSPSSLKARAGEKPPVTASGGIEWGRSLSISLNKDLGKKPPAGAPAKPVDTGVSLSGSLSLTLSMGVKWHKEWWSLVPDLIEVTNIQSQKIEGTITASVTVQKTFGPYMILPSTTLAPIPLGPLTLMVEVGADLEVVVSGEFGVKASIKWSKKSESGFRWTPSGGVRAIKSAEKDQGIKPSVQVFGKGAVKIQPNIELSLELYGAAGPFLGAKPFLEAAVEVTGDLLPSRSKETPVTAEAVAFEFTLAVGLEGEVGGKIDFFGFKKQVSLTFPVTAKYTFWRIEVTTEDPDVPDETAPIITHNAASTYSSAATIRLTATDAGGTGVKEIRYRLDGGAVKTVAGATANVSVSVAGRHEIEMWAIDKADNESQHRTAVFTIAYPQAERWFVKAFNIDDEAYISVNGQQVVHLGLKQNGDWVEITHLLSARAADTTIEMKTWNASGSYTWGYSLGRQRGADAAPAPVWSAIAGTAGVTGAGANGNDTSRPNSWVYTNTKTIGQLAGL